MTRPRIAFYAPLKPPDHAIPSGDRVIASLMIAALEQAGYEVEIVSRFVSYAKGPDKGLFEARRQAGQAEAARLSALWTGGSTRRPDLWFTYHPYCKAPDWVGPAMARALDIPYVTAEACRTAQGGESDWRPARAAVQAAVRHAAVNFCLKPSDEAYLRSFLPDSSSMAALAPFIDTAPIAAIAPAAQAGLATQAGPLVVAAGMMRPGAKCQSYRLLADALSGLDDIPWRLVVIGDGPERGTVEAMFGFASPGRVHFAGAIAREEVLGWMKAADLFAWPGIREAIGMVYLEAQACGLAVAACATAGVPLVVRNAQTGLLAETPDAAAYRAVLRRLLCDKAERETLRANAPAHVAAHHSLRHAAAVLKARLDPLVAEKNPSLPETAR